MEPKYRARVQGESLQGKIREYEFRNYDEFIYPVYFGVLTLFAFLYLINIFLEYGF